MKAFLMYRDKDFALKERYPPNAADLVQDLELGTLLGTMAAGDKFLLEVADSAVLAPLPDPGTIVYHQRLLADCTAQPEIGLGVGAAEHATARTQRPNRSIRVRTNGSTSE